jgi:hypothetical protein
MRPRTKAGPGATQSGLSEDRVDGDSVPCTGAEQKVGVRPQREAGVRVPQPPRQGDDGLAGLQFLGGVEVAQRFYT